MFFATYTNLLQVLGFAIINSLWQAAMVWLCYVAINSFFKLSPSKKYLVSVICELIVFAGFVISITINLFSSANSYSTKIFTQAPLQNKQWISSPFLPIISSVYLIVLVVMMIKWLISFFNTQKVYSNNLIYFEMQWQQWIEHKAKELNIQRAIKIFVTKYVRVPLTIGFLKPVILLPVAITNHLTVEELETILLHELAHIKRADYLINILLSLVETILYFNPFIFYFKKIIKRERENICDDEVLLRHYAPIQYAESLLKLAKFSLNKKDIVFAMSAANSHQQELLQRIKRITKTEIKPKNKFSFILSLTLFISIFITLGLLYIPAHTSHQLQSVNNKKEQQKEFPSTAIPPILTSEKNIISAKTLQIKKQKEIIIEKKRVVDEKLNVALESLKHITIPILQNNIEEYRKTLSGSEAQQLADNNLKQRIKNYVTGKNISINDFIKKVDSVKIIQEHQFASTNTISNNNIIIPASYIEKDSLNQYIQQHKQQIKHFVIIPNNNAAPYYLIIRSFNENKEPLYLFIPYTPEKIVD